MEKIAFSFVMPAFKRKFLYDSIDSILKQTYNDFELVIVNDASPEDLKSVVELFNDQRIIYKENATNIGGHDLVANWNHCIRFAKHDYVILAADDDLFDYDFLSEASILIKKYPEVDIIRSGVKKIDEQNVILDKEFLHKEYMTCREFTLYWAKGGTISCISNYIFRKNALENINGFVSFPHAHYSDDATALALSANGIVNLKSNLMSFRVSKINLSNRTDLNIVKEQLSATELFMGWYLKHVDSLDTIPNDYFERACYGGFKSRYLMMIENLLSKVPLSKMILAIRIIYSTNYLFKRERLKLLANYLIDKL